MDMMLMGNIYAMIGAGIAIIFTGIGASIGMAWVQQASAGVTSEDPDKFGKTLILQLIPSSGALYGFVVAFLILLNAVLADGGGYTPEQGLMILVVSLPIGIVGMFATLGQSRVCAAGVRMIGKNDELAGRALTMAVFIELFALFALIVSILGVFSVIPTAGIYEDITETAQVAAQAVTNMIA